ncbi:MAG: sugar ABC transporter permease [Rhodospirillales bacterium]|nr:sugar ABC transporter permease [Rhodospirillales bacterium]
MTRFLLSRTAVHGWLMLLPAGVLLASFTHIPAVMTFVNSFFSTAMGKKPSKFIGVENYVFLLEDEIFHQTLLNNIVFALGTIPTSIGIAIGMALWVNGKLRGRAVVRFSFFLPTMLPMIAAANIWMFFYTPSYGLVDQFLGLFGYAQNNWLGDPDTVLPCLMVLTIWKEAGFFMIFYLAALQSLPTEIYEAAKLEGVGRWYYFRRVTFPLLMPTTLFVMVNALINSFKMVDMLFVMTDGGPDNASNLLLYYIYETAFSFWDTAYAATLTVVLFLVLAITAIAQFVYFDKRIHYR